MISKPNSGETMTFGEHLDVLRKMLLRILILVFLLAVVVFCMKNETWSLLLAPTNGDFLFYKCIRSVTSFIGIETDFGNLCVQLINTELSAQLMTHFSISFYLSLLLSSPYILYELFMFISPGLYEHERRYTIPVLILAYCLFTIGVVINYFVIFPVSFQFLANYQVSTEIKNMITLSSYVSTFFTLTFVMGVVFQLPVISFLLSRLGIINANVLIKYRKHAIMIITVVAAAITPPDIISCLLVMLPMYLLYECSIYLVKHLIKVKT